jgi:glycosyltransferase involved in cell wall biosynthesis
VSSIARTIRSISPDVVHAQGLGIYAAAAVRGPWLHVVTTHGIVFREAEFTSGLVGRWRGFVDSRFERYYLARVRAFISINPYVEQEMARIGGVHGTVYRVENPVEDAFFGVNCPSEGSTVLYAGRVIARKGLLELLRALIEVRKSVPEVRLRVAGEIESAPGYLEACRQFIAQYGLDGVVRFLGPLTVAQMVEEYARCTVLALTSKQETAPVAVAEAMAAARPVVATRVCGVPYMVEEERSGLLVEYGDRPALADALTRVLSDDALRARMGQRGREIAQSRFNADHIARETQKVYQQILNRSGVVYEGC